MKQYLPADRCCEGQRASRASEPRERSAPAKRRARERVGESEGQSPSDNVERPFEEIVLKAFRQGRFLA